MFRCSLRTLVSLVLIVSIVGGAVPFPVTVEAETVLSAASTAPAYRAVPASTGRADFDWLEAGTWAGSQPSMETETGEAKIALSSTVPVSVTDNGFDPDVVTVTVGATGEWTNHTQETVHLQSGEPYRIYLPLVLRNVGGAGGQTASAPEPTSQAEVRLTASTTFSGTLPPGGTFTHTFTSDGDYPYFLTDNPAWAGLVNVEPIPFDFEMGATPLSHSVAQGQGVTYTVRITGTLGDPQPVTLTVGGLPGVAAWGLNPSMVVPTSTAVLSITTALTTPVGNHTLVITGTGGGQIHTATATLVVTPYPDFEVAVAPAVRSIAQGQSVTYTVSLTGWHGFDKPVSLSVDGSPAGTAAIWDQNPLTPTDTTVLTITTSLTTPLGSYLLAVTGAGGGFSHQVPITLEATPHPDFALGVVPDTRSVRQSRAVTATVMLTALHGFAAPVALSAGGLPAGVMSDWATNPLTSEVRSDPDTLEICSKYAVVCS